MNFVDNFLNRITMYRLVLYYLIALLGVATLFDSLGILPYRPANLAFSTLLILAVCWLANFVFARIFGAEPNAESVYITACILALIIAPVAPGNAAGTGFSSAAATVASASACGNGAILSCRLSRSRAIRAPMTSGRVAKNCPSLT